MKPTRLTQPMRKGARAPSLPLSAAMRGRTMGGLNPADVKRAGYLIAAGKKHKRPARPDRPPRPPR